MGKSDRQELLASAQEALETALSRAPALGAPELLPLAGEEPGHPDLFVRLPVAAGQKTLACLILPRLFPKDVLATTLLLKRWVSRSAFPNGYPVIIAPFVSTQSAKVLIEEDVGFVDLAGNFRLAFDLIFLEREVPGNPMRERREIRNLFTPQAARVLLALLTRKGPWQGTRLAKEAGVSMGYVSSLKQVLSNNEWVQTERTRIELARPDALLDAWRVSFEPPKVQQFYTNLHGERLHALLPQVLSSTEALLAGPSAASYIAPYARASSLQFLTTKAATEKLKATLGLTAVTKGANVLVEQVDESDMRFEYAQAQTSGVFTTDPVSTYLSLWSQGERMQEAAEHLRTTCLTPLWNSWLDTPDEQ